MLTLPY